MTNRGKSLVMLGAADGAVSTYRRARELGYRVIAVDQRATAPAVRYADQLVAVSTRDPAAVAAALRGRADIAGVLAPASDAALPAQRELCRIWGIADAPSAEIVRASTDKSWFRGRLDRLGLPGYRFVSGAPAVVAAAAGTLRLPVVVKPVDSTGSRGLTLCTTPEEVAPAIAAAARFAHSGVVLAEECVAGAHFAAECVVDAGRIAFLAISARTLTPPPHLITAAQTLPAELPQEAQLIAMLDAVCADLAYARGPLNVDFVVTPDGQVVLVELGARVGGNGIGELILRCYGVDTIAASIDAAAGRPITVAPTVRRYADLRIITAPGHGVLRAIRGVDEVSALPEVADLVLFAGPGDPVRPYTQAADKVGYLVTVADSAAASAGAATGAMELLRCDLVQ